MSYDYKNFAMILEHFQCKTVLDIGANNAVWARDLKHYFRPVEITCIEANPACEESLKLAGFPYIIAALSDSNKKLKFYTNVKNPSCTGVSYYKENSEHYTTTEFFEVETTTLDQLFTNEKEKSNAFEAELMNMLKDGERF